jgi:phosphoserine phosphatase RsbU/P
LEDAIYQTSEIILEPRDLVLLYTDGLVEIENAQQDLYSTQLLVEAVRRRLDQPSGQLFNELLEEARRFAAHGAFTDDVCLVGMDYLGPEKQLAERENKH